jgi:uncharacterized protein (TIGR02145 family)
MADVMMPENNNEGNITITIDVPSAASTRAITEGSANDHAINRIDVLIFNANTDLYISRVSPVFINDGVNSNQKTFTIKVPKGNLELLILANSKDAIDAATLVTGATTKAQAYTQLTEVLPTGNIWNAQPGSPGYKPFPMWGEVPNINTNTATTASATLVRALAKINVRFSNTLVGGILPSDKLTITGISLYNYHTNGKLASQNWNFTTPASSTPDPTAMTFKQGGFANGVNFPTSVIVGNQIIDEIFLFEVAPPANPANPTVADRVASTCIIISGYYKGADPTNTTELSYYRIDLRSDAGVYYGVTRNHNYDILIQDVRGPGANTGEIAYDSELVNITATVREWGAGYEVDVDYSGQYKMITNDSEFTFLSTGMPAQMLEIFSDHPGGWTVEPGYPDWINLSITASNNTTGFVDMEITCNQYTGNTVRTGEFFIRTEGLRKKITVIQVPLSQLNPADMDICPNISNSIVLGAATAPAGTITYRWEMSTDNVTWTPAPTPNNVQNYIIAANTLTADTYFRRVAIWGGFEIESSSALISVPVLGNFPQSVDISGTTWSTRNLDLSTPSMFTNHPSELGMFFQYNRNTGWSVTDPRAAWVPATSSWNEFATWTSTGDTGNAWQTPANDPCPSGWRLPTREEFNSLVSSSPLGSDGWAGQWLTADQASTLGLGCAAGRIFGPNANTVISGGNVVPGNFNPNTMLFLPAAGWRTPDNGVLTNPGANGTFWSSTPNATTGAELLHFHSNLVAFGVNFRSFGLSVRCVEITTITITQPDPAPATNCPNETYTITLAPATGAPAGEITYQWQSSTDNINWSNIITNGTSVDYTIPVNTFTSNTYFRRQATAQGTTITSAAALISLLTLRTDIPDFVTIGSGADARRWSTRNLDTPGVFAEHSSSLGRFYQWGTVGGNSNHYTSIDPLSPAWNTTANNLRFAWTPTGNDPCFLARSAGSPNWRLPAGTDTTGDFFLLLNASPNGSDGDPGQWITRDQAAQLGLGCTPGRLFGPDVNTVISGDNVVPSNFNPNTMLFLPIAGWRIGTDGMLANQGSSGTGFYWSSTPNGTTFAWYLFFASGISSNNSFVSYVERNNGFSIRCVAETITQPDPSDMTICPNVANTISLGAATSATGSITYRWEMSTDNVAWTPAPTPNNVQNYTIVANTLVVDTYFRRVAISNGVEIMSTPAQVSTGLRNDIPASITIGGIIWNTRNVDAPGTVALHPSFAGMLYQLNRNTGWSSIDPRAAWVPATSSWNTAAPWDANGDTGNAWETSANDPCPVTWRLPAPADFSTLFSNSAVGSDGQPGQWLDQAQVGQLGLGCAPGRLFGPGVNTVISSGNVAPGNFNPNTMLFLPAVGTRSLVGGVLSFQGERGNYWSNSYGLVGSVTTGRMMSFTSGGAIAENGTHPAWGQSLRCISE